MLFDTWASKENQALKIRQHIDFRAFSEACKNKENSFIPSAMDYRRRPYYVNNES